SGPHTVQGQTPLNMRWFGYDAKSVSGYWGALESAERSAEQRFLKLDLLFPVFYGGALAFSLVTASAMLGKPAHAGWVIAPVVVTVVADWVENLVQLNQLRNYIERGEEGLVAGWIKLASTATIVKLIFFSISGLTLVTLLTLVVIKIMSTKSVP
ncbi:MAG: hypothetical protein H7210_13005, partial [Pyrinomonadaceae bacterium]|nr:hypothetical protein [Phycisphaerales bacterium]